METPLWIAAAAAADASIYSWLQSKFICRPLRRIVQMLITSPTWMTKSCSPMMMPSLVYILHAPVSLYSFWGEWITYMVCVCIWHRHIWTTMADALPTPMVMRFMCARNVFVCLFLCILFSCRVFFSRSHAQVDVLVKIIHRHYSAITLVKALAHSTTICDCCWWWWRWWDMLFMMNIQKQLLLNT